MSLKKRIEIENIVRITASSRLDEFVVHQKYMNDNLYLSKRKMKLLLQQQKPNNRLKFVSVEEEGLRDYATYKSDKTDNPNYTLMKTYYKYIESNIDNKKKEKGKNDDN